MIVVQIKYNLEERFMDEPDRWYQIGNYSTLGAAKSFRDRLAKQTKGSSGPPFEFRIIKTTIEIVE